MSTGNLPVSENSTCKPPVHLSDGCVPFRCASEPCQWASLNISKAYVYWKWSATLVNGGGKKKNPSVVCTEGFQSGRYSLQLCHAVFIQELSSSSWMWAKTWTWIGRLNIHSVGEGLGRCIIHCHIAIIYEWQRRYDQRCGRVNRIPKGQWQGLGEGFIIADFIDVLQSCVCVCERERAGTVTEPWRRKIGIKMKKHHSI